MCGVRISADDRRKGQSNEPTNQVRAHQLFSGRNLYRRGASSTARRFRGRRAPDCVRDSCQGATSAEPYVAVRLANPPVARFADATSDDFVATVRAQRQSSLSIAGKNPALEQPRRPSSRTSSSAACTPPSTRASPINFASSIASTSAGSKCWPRVGRTGFQTTVISSRR
jgi:hypothetical protein